MLYASAVNVVAITLIAAIAGIRRLSWCWLPARIAPPPARNSSGSTKLKKAALGLRPNILRSRRDWRQPSAIALSPLSASAIGGQLQVDVLERRAPDAQLLERFAARQRLGGQPVQQRCRVIGLALDQLTVAIAVGD